MENLAIITGSMSRGGAEKVALSLAQYIQGKDINVVLMTSTRVEYEYEVPVELHRVVLDDDISVGNKFIRMCGIIHNLRKSIREYNINTALIMGVPLCIFAIPGCKGIRVVVSERNDPTHFEGKKIIQKISRIMMKKADGYVYQTHDAQNFYRGIMNTEGVVIPNPLLSGNLGKPFEGTREKTIVTAGRLIKQKNQMMLLEAFAEVTKEHKDYKLILYGEGYLRNQLEQFIKEHGLQDKITLPGNVSNLPEQIRKAGIFVLPSNFEGMPNALIEAMAMGVPCISTNCPCGGPRDLIDEGKNGLLIPVGDKSALVSALCQMIENEDHASEMGRNAVAIRNMLNMQAIGDRWIDYLRLVS